MSKWKKNLPAKKKSKKPVKAKTPDVPPAKTCGEIHGTCCPKHPNEPCNIPIEFHPDDSRNQWVAALHALGAKSHTKDDKHRCKICEEAQVESSPWRFLKVPGSENNPPSAIDAADIAAHLEEMGWDV